jgi:hypothetical protein
MDQNTTTAATSPAAPSHVERTQALAARLYPDAKPAQAPAPAPAADAVAAKLYAPAPAAPVDQAPTAELKALRDAQPERRMYADAKQLGAGPRELALAIDPTASEKTLAERASSLASVAIDCGLTRDDVAMLAARAREYATKPPSAQQEVENARKAVLDMRSKYGTAFSAAFEAGRQLAQRDPRLSKLLDTSRLGNHPAVIALFAEKGMEARRRGELK